MDPSRKRTIRFVVALSAALLLATALAYTSFSASTEARQPSELVNASATPGKKYQLVGKVVKGYETKGDTTYFHVRDRNGTASVPVTYTGRLPDPFVYFAGGPGEGSVSWGMYVAGRKLPLWNVWVRASTSLTGRPRRRATRASGPRCGWSEFF